ncbi:MAG TPA: restriction endonuclease [Burkholderiaceae bacterium]|nr:restriction endonuclease [Burkholderiaceae bacterium]
MTRDSPSRLSPELLSQIEWRRFEALVEALFRMSGFETRSQSHGADGGVDLWLYARSQPDTPVGIVQCKHWNGRRVGVDKMRELRGVMASHGLHRAQFATTSAFTPDAIEFASGNGIHLLDGQSLLRLIAKRSEQEQAALLAVATEGEYWRPTCVNCGIKLVERASRDNGKSFWGCANYPRCRTTMPMREA